MKTQDISKEELYKIVEEKDRRIAELEKQVEWLLSQFRLARHRQYGTSSEQTDSRDVYKRQISSSNYLFMIDELDKSVL